MPIIGIPMLEDAARALFGPGGGDGSDSRPPRPLLEAQCDELLRYFADYHEPYAFKPGELAVPKPGLGPIREDDTYAFIFWRYLDLGNPLDLALAQQAVKSHFVATADCLAGMIVTENGHASVQIRVFDSATLRPHPYPAQPAASAAA